MSIDEVMERTIEYGLMMRTATISESRALNTSIRAAIEQHVAEAVEKEITRRARIIESQDACPSFCNRMATRRAARGTP